MIRVARTPSDTPTTSSVTGELQYGVQSGLNELVGKKPQLRTDFALTLLPRLRIKSQAISHRRTSSLGHPVPLWIDRAGDSLDFSFILYLIFQARKLGAFSRRWSIRVLTPPTVNLSRNRATLIHSRPLPKSLEMDRQFPPEIIQLIVEASLDPYDLFNLDWSELDSRYKILKKYALLNWTWRGASAPSLHELVVIDTEEQAASFLDLLDAEGGIIDGIRDFRFTLDAADRSDIARILRSAGMAVNVSLDHGMVSVDDLAHLQQLRLLEIYKVELVGSPASSNLSLPSLRSLHIFAVSISPSATHFLTPSSLPQLRHLQLWSSPVTVDSLIPQLHAISFQPIAHHSLSGARSVQLLHFHYPSDKTDTVLSQLPSLPPFISIDFGAKYSLEDFAEEVIDALEQLLASPKKGVRVLLLPDHGIDETRKAAIKQVEGRAIRGVWERRSLDFDGAILAMERVLAEEKRAVEKVKESKRR